jgi:eukaryotic-like serine/threonine-protein kinase
MTQQITASHHRDAVSQLGPYRLGEIIGRGGMGVVYRATHVDTGAEVAIKRVSSVTGSHLAGLRAEIRTLARLRHPGIVQILDEGLEEGVPWYAMELLVGTTLSSVLDVVWNRAAARALTTITGPIDPGSPEAAPAPRAGAAMAGRLPETLATMVQICEALAYVHEQGIVHRDLKPSNVFIRGRDGRAVLMDFGLVSRFRGTLGRENLETPGLGAGTACYIAPEQVRRELVDARADLYSLGCVMYEMLTGAPPFTGSNVADVREQHLSTPAGRPSAFTTGIPPALDELVLALLAKRPQDRIGYAVDVLDALAALGAPVERGTGARAGGGDGRGDGGSKGARSYLYRPRLTGRSEEVQQLLTLVRRAIATGGAANKLLCIGGESGCGKTTLANELARQASVSGLRVISGECLPLAGESTVMDPREAPLHPLHPLLRAIGDHCRAGGPELARRIFGPWCPLFAAHEPALLDLPGTDAAEPPALPGEAARDRLLGALKDVILAFSREVPLLLVLDDLQWADEMSLGFLRAVQNGLLAGASIAVVGTYRSEEVSPALEPVVNEPTSPRVLLRRLDAGVVRTIVADMLGMARPPEALITFLVRVSEGNPFFVAEYLRAATAEGLLSRQGGRWHPPERSEGSESAYEAIALPRSIQGLVGRRLEGLSPAARALAGQAAVLGREAEGGVLRAMSTLPADDVGRHLGELVERQVLDAVGLGRYRFVHDKIREAAFEALPADERTATHLRAGEALEAHGHADPFELSHHFRCGARPAKAFHYSCLAGQRARAAGAFRQASVHLGSALELADTHAAVLVEIGDPERRADLQRHLAEALVASGQYERGIESFRRTCAQLALPVPPRRALAWAAAGLGECLRLLAFRLLGLGGRKSDRRRRQLEIGADMMRWVSQAYLFSGRPMQCVVANLVQTRLADQAGSDNYRCAGYAFLGSIFGLAGLRGLERRLVAISRASAARATDILYPIWQATVEALFVHYRNADWPALRAGTAPALATAIEHNLVYDRQPLDFARAMADIEEGHVPSALAQLTEIRDRARTLGHHGYEISAQAALLYCTLHAGRLDEVIAAADQAAATIRRHELDTDLFMVLTTRACACMRASDLAGAAALAGQAVALLDQGANLEMRPLAVRSLFELCDVLTTLWRQALMDRAPARGPLADIERRAVAACRRLRRLSRRRAHVAPAALLHEARVHELRGRGARAVRVLEGALTAARALGLRPYEAQAHLDLARLPEVPAAERRRHAALALSLFEQMGYGWHAARADALARAIAENGNGSP